VQDSPDIDTITLFDIENEIWKIFDRPATNTWQIKFKRIARRPARRVANDMTKSVFEGVHKMRGDLTPPASRK